MQRTSTDINERGFTIPEVIIAGVIMVIISVGTLETFVYATRMNRGNNFRMQALSVLQQEVEYFRSLQFVPGLETTADLNNHRSNDIRAGTRVRGQRTSADGHVFNLTVTVTNLSTPNSGTNEEVVRYKEITITAQPVVVQQGWLSNANLNTSVTVQRVRAN
jgi:type II secretory pathway pseudopilin PulG